MSIASVEQLILGKTYIQGGQIIFDAWKNNQLTLPEYQQMANFYEVWTGGNQIITGTHFTTTTQSRAEIYEETGEYQEQRSQLVTQDQVVANLIAKQEQTNIISNIPSTTFTSTSKVTTTTGTNVSELKDEDENLLKSLANNPLFQFIAPLPSMAMGSDLSESGAIVTSFIKNNPLGQIIAPLPSMALQDSGTSESSEENGDFFGNLGNQIGGAVGNLASSLGEGIGSGVGSIGAGLLPIGLVILGGLFLVNKIMD